MDTGIQIHVTYNIQAQNQKIINDYIEARKIETNLAISTQKVTSDTLNRFSRKKKKHFKDITRDDLLSFLNSLRKSETQDPSHKWIGTYNHCLIIISTFFKWLYNPQVGPKDRQKPDVLLNIKQLKRKETSSYKPTDMWTQEDVLLFSKYCPSKRDKMLSCNFNG